MKPIIPKVQSMSIAGMMPLESADITLMRGSHHGLADAIERPMAIVNILGLSLIALIIWWFWLYRPRGESGVNVTTGTITIVVENGLYEPARVVVPSGKPTSLTFLRKDPSPCAGTVVFADLEISEELPLNRELPIQLPALSAGSYPFTCQMQMYRGELIAAGDD